MVLIQAKTPDEENDIFAIETSTESLIANIKEELVKICNLRKRVLKLADAALELVEHGCLRPEELRGISDEELKISNNNENPFKDATNPDRYNFRTGIPPPTDCAKQLKEICRYIKKQLSVEQAEKYVTVTLEMLNSFLQSIISALQSCYPKWEDLPSYDTTRIIIEKEDFFKDELTCGETSIWWAGKEMPPTKHLKELIGKNEKSKLKVKLQRTKDGPPVRESRIDQETYKAMLAYYHKKTKEEKEMEEDDDDSYLNSEWANPLNLQKQLHGNLSDIKWKP